MGSGAKQLPAPAGMLLLSSLGAKIDKAAQDRGQLNLGLLPQDRAGGEATEADSGEECRSSDADKLHSDAPN